MKTSKAKGTKKIKGWIGKKVLAHLAYITPEAIIIGEAERSVKIRYDAKTPNYHFQGLEIWIPKEQVEIITPIKEQRKR